MDLLTRYGLGNISFWCCILYRETCSLAREIDRNIQSQPRFNRNPLASLFTDFFLTHHLFDFLAYLPIRLLALFLLFCLRSGFTAPTPRFPASPFPFSLLLFSSHLSKFAEVPTGTTTPAQPFLVNFSIFCPLNLTVSLMIFFQSSRLCAIFRVNSWCPS